MSIDTSMYGKFELPAPPNLLTAANQIGAMNNQMLQNQLLQNELESQEALGGVLKSATGAEGKVDFQKLLSGMAAHPKLAKQFPEYYKKLREAELVDAQVAKAALEATGVRTEMLGKMAQMVLATPGADRAKVVSIVAGTLGRPDSGFTPGEALNILLMAGESPEEIKQQAQTLAAGALETKEFLKLNQDAVKQIDLGGSVAQVKVDPITQKPTVVSSFDKTMDPNKLNEPVAGFDSNNNPMVVRTGDPRLGPILSGNGQAPAQVSPQAPVQPQTQIPTQTPAQTSPGAFSMKPTAQLEIDEKNVQKFEEGLNQRAQSFPNSLATVRRAIELVPNVGVGPGAETRRTLGEAALAIGADKGLVEKMIGGDIAATQELGKILLQQSVESMRAAYGNVYQQFSTQEFESFAKNTPNLSTSEAALMYMLKKAEALTELQELEQELYVDWKEYNSNKPIPGAGFSQVFAKKAKEYLEQHAKDNNYLPEKKEDK